MARVKRGVTTHARHKKVLGQSKGFFGRSSTNYRIALERLEKSLQYAYRDRRVKKREFRGLWTQRINAAVRERGAGLNRLKDELAAAIEARRTALEAAALDARLAAERIDVTLPPRPSPAGLVHPISRTMDEMAAIFGAMGFEIAEGPDIEN